MAGINTRNYIVYDLETSNLLEEGGEIVQIGATALRYQDFEIHEVGSFEKILKPEFPENASPKAIEIIGQELWDKANKEGVHQKTGLKQFKNFMWSVSPRQAYWDAPIRVGFNNCKFDDPMLEKWMKHYKLVGVKKDDNPWSYLSLDVAQYMFAMFGCTDRDLQNNKLDTYADLMGLKRSAHTHDAMEDVILTTEIFQRYMRLMVGIRPKIKFKNLQ